MSSTIWKFENLWDGLQWQSPALIETDEQGVIQFLHFNNQTKANTEANTLKVDEYVPGWAVPGFQNAHSHAFQFAMAGMTEFIHTHHTPDNFWSWRQKMYQCALSLTPRQVEVIATQLYSQLLKNGYTWVAEFHYLHHDPRGKPYSKLSEMGEALLQAAEKTGIGLTLIPIFYNQGGFHTEPQEEQRRFISKNIHEYLKLHELTQNQCRGLRQKCALGIHSLRAIKPEDIHPLVEEAPKDQVWHIHIAEQRKEVSESLQVLGQRPVQWLMNQLDINSNWNFVHATHIDEKEIQLLQKKQVNCVICPSTEGNLGDGVFPLKTYWQGGGRWSMGTDSHIGLNPLEELRWLDYVQRLDQKERNILCRQGGDQSGELIFNEALQSGRRAMGWPHPARTLEVGDLLDLVVVQPETLLWQETSPQHLLSTLIYATSPSDFSGVITSGRWVIQKEQHSQDDLFSKDWSQHVSHLRNL